MDAEIPDNLIKDVLEIGLEKTWKIIEKLGIEGKRKLLDLWLRADFEKYILPEEIELGLLEKERKYPKLLFSPKEMPTELEKRRFLISFDWEDPQFQYVIRCAYWISLLVDNFLSEMKTVLPLEGRYALALSQAEIRASIRGENDILQLFGSYSGEDFELPSSLLDYLGKKVVRWDVVRKFKKKIDVLLEAGFYFSIFLPIIIDFCKERHGKITRKEREIFIKLLDHLYEMEIQIRTRCLVPEMRIFDSKILGKIGFVPVNEEDPTTIVSYIEEKYKEGCQSVIVLSRNLTNNSIAIQAVVLAFENLENINIPIGIRKISFEESYKPGLKWFNGIRIFITKDYKDDYLKEVNEILKFKDKFFEVPSYKLTLIMSEDPKDKNTILKFLQNQLGKRRRLIVSVLGGNDASYLTEVVQLLAKRMHFTKKIIFFVEENKIPRIRFCIDMKLIK